MDSSSSHPIQDSPTSPPPAPRSPSPIQYSPVITPAGTPPARALTPIAHLEGNLPETLPSRVPPTPVTPFARSLPPPRGTLPPSPSPRPHFARPLPPPRGTLPPPRPPFARPLPPPRGTLPPPPPPSLCSPKTVTAPVVPTSTSPNGNHEAPVWYKRTLPRAPSDRMWSFTPLTAATDAYVYRQVVLPRWSRRPRDWRSQVCRVLTQHGVYSRASVREHRSYSARERSLRATRSPVLAPARRGH